MVFGEAVSSSMCSFNQSASSTPTISPAFSLSASSTPTISPAFSLADICVEGAVLHYRVVSQERQQEEDKKTLAEVATKISDFNTNLTSFQPSLAVITTWKLTNNIGRVSKLRLHDFKLKGIVLGLPFSQTLYVFAD